MYHFILFLSVYLSIYLTCLSLPFSSVRSFFPFAQCKAWSARSFEVNYYYSSSDFCPNFWNQEILPLPFVQRTNMHLVTYVNCRLNCYISKHGVSKGLIQFLDAVFKMWIVIGKCFLHFLHFKPFDIGLHLNLFRVKSTTFLDSKTCGNGLCIFLSNFFFDFQTNGQGQYKQFLSKCKTVLFDLFVFERNKFHWNFEAKLYQQSRKKCFCLFVSVIPVSQFALHKINKQKEITLCHTKKKEIENFCRKYR